MAHHPYESETFSKQFKQLCKKDKPLEKKLNDAIDEILQNPENFDSTLKASRSGSVKKKAVKERYRIIYRYCERCLMTNKKSCADCTTQKRPTKSVIFEEVFHRDEGY